MVDFSCALKLAMPLTVLSAIRQAKKFVETNLIEEIVNNINCMEEKSND